MKNKNEVDFGCPDLLKKHLAGLPLERDIDAENEAILIRQESDDSDYGVLDDYDDCSGDLAANELYDDFRMVEELLISALEGGSKYWYMILDHNKKEVPECEFLSTLLMHEKGRMKIKFDSGKDDFKWIEHKDLLPALELFRTKHRKHYDDLKKRNGDAETGDIYFQLLVMGEVVYG